MVEILSQDEIEALLSSLSGQSDAGEETAQAAVTPSAPMPDSRASGLRDDKAGDAYETYDFRRPDKFSKEQLRSLQVLHETFARLFATSLSAYLRTSCHVDLVSVEQVPYDEYMRSLTSSVINVFSMAPLAGQSILEVEFNVALSMIDRLLGGPGNMVKLGTQLTEIERALTESIIHRALKELKTAWEGVAQFNPVHETMETQAQFIQIIPPNDVVVSILFEIKFGELRGAMSLCIPYLALKPIITKFSAQRWFSDKKRSGHNATTLAKRIESTYITAVCRLGTTQIDVKELMELQVGDTIALNRKFNDEVDLMIGNKVKFRGKPGKSGRKVAIHVNRIVSEDSFSAPTFNE